MSTKKVSIRKSVPPVTETDIMTYYVSYCTTCGKVKSIKYAGVTVPFADRPDHYRKATGGGDYKACVCRIKKVGIKRYLPPVEEADSSLVVIRHCKDCGDVNSIKYDGVPVPAAKRPEFYARIHPAGHYEKCDCRRLKRRGVTPKSVARQEEPHTPELQRVWFGPSAVKELVRNVRSYTLFQLFQQAWNLRQIVVLLSESDGPRMFSEAVSEGWIEETIEYMDSLFASIGLTPEQAKELFHPRGLMDFVVNYVAYETVTNVQRTERYRETVKKEPTSDNEKSVSRWSSTTSFGHTIRLIAQNNGPFCDALASLAGHSPRYEDKEAADIIDACFAAYNAAKA